MTPPAAGPPQLVPPPERPLWRLGLRGEPLVWRSPRPLPDMGASPSTPGSRFDAPTGEFATVYFATEPYGACLEKLAPLRLDLTLIERIDAFLVDEPDPDHDIPLQRNVPRDFCDDHVFVTADVDPEARFIDIDHADTHRALHAVAEAGDLNADLLAILQEHDIARIDRGTFLSHLRPLTRQLALQLYDLYGHPPIIGLRYPSALDRTAECWAIWDIGEPRVHHPDIAPVDFSNTSLRRAADQLGLRDPLTPDGA